MNVGTNDFVANIHDYNTLRPHEALEYATPEEIYRSSFGATTAADLDSAALAC